MTRQSHFNLLSSFFITCFVQLTWCVDDGTKVALGMNIATEMYSNIKTLFENCVESSMPSQNFIMDDLQGFVNFPHMTTIGISQKFTVNRKFFANMMMSHAYREMLAMDMEIIRKNLVKKYRFCDAAIMDQDLLKDFYDREVDQRV